MTGAVDMCCSRRVWTLGDEPRVRACRRRFRRRPGRHEAGSPNVLGAIALAAACATLREHRRLVTHREEDLTERLVAGLRAIDGVETFSIFGEDHDRAPVGDGDAHGGERALRVRRVVEGDRRGDDDALPAGAPAGVPNGGGDGVPAQGAGEVDDQASNVESAAAADLERAPDRELVLKPARCS